MCLNEEEKPNNILNRLNSQSKVVDELFKELKFVDYQLPKLYSFQKKIKTIFHFDQY